jgi:hypothetical protein
VNISTAVFIIELDVEFSDAFASYLCGFPASLASEQLTTLNLKYRLDGLIWDFRDLHGIDTEIIDVTS